MFLFFLDFRAYTFQPTLKCSLFLRLKRKKKIRKMGKERKNEEMNG